ncbi:MAG: hypothetical protein J5483_05010 [Lachnospiraceae bacterium]|nr:hypothetical protein [Lachnospiraceae bacterium]
MKQLSPMFPFTCILLIVAGAVGLIMDFLLAVEKLKAVDCPKFLAVLVIVFGLAWGIAAILVGIGGYTEAKRIILQQRRKRTASRQVKTHLSLRQLGIRAIFIIVICAIQILFALLTGLKIWQLCLLLLIGIVIPYLFLLFGRGTKSKR